MNVMAGAGVPGAPSNGFYGLLFATSICRRITVFGFQKNWKTGSARVPYHYYDAVEPNDSQFRRDNGEASVFSAFVEASNTYVRESRDAGAWQSWAHAVGWTGERITLVD